MSQPQPKASRWNHALTGPETLTSGSWRSPPPNINPILIYNTYNQTAADSEEPHSRADTTVLIDLNLTTRTILAGDFNTKHQLWDSTAPENGERDGTLIDIIDENELLPLNKPDKGSHILKNGTGLSVPDLVLYSLDLNTEIDGWAREKQQHSGFDHYAM